MTPKLHLFLAPGACSLGPHILLNEAELPFTFTAINVWNGFPDEHRHLNPKGQVPFLHLETETITEVPAIITAISQLAPTSHLLGNTPLDTVRVYEWMNWMTTTLHKQAYGGFFRPQWFVEDEGLYEQVKAKSLKSVGNCYEFIEEKLKGRTCAVGDGFTAADANLYVFYRWGVQSGFDMKGKYPNYTALAEKVDKRPSVVKTLEEEGLKPLEG